MTPDEHRALDRQVAERVFGWTLKTMGARYDPDCGGLEVCVDCEYGPPDWSDLGLEPDPNWQHSRHDSEEPCYQEQNAWRVVPEFSTRIEDAWTIVERMAADGWYYEILNSGNEVYVIFCLDPDDPYSGKAPRAPLAIVRAALAAVRKEGQGE